MENLKSNEPYLEMAIQSVLYHYKNQLEYASHHDNQELLKVMAAEINLKASQFKKITDTALKQLEE